MAEDLPEIEELCGYNHPLQPTHDLETGMSEHRMRECRIPVREYRMAVTERARLFAVGRAAVGCRLQVTHAVPQVVDAATCDHPLRCLRFDGIQHTDITMLPQVTCDPERGGCGTTRSLPVRPDVLARHGYLAPGVRGAEAP